MALSQRDYDGDDAPDEPRELQSIEGGGEGDGVPRGQLHSVEDPERWGAEQQPSHPLDDNTGNSVGRKDFYKPDDDLKKREERALSDDLDHGTANDESKGFRYNPDQKGKIRGGKATNWKKRGIIGGIITSVIGGGVGLISFLIPFKADYIQNIIDLKFNSRVEATIEERAENTMGSYLSQTLRGYQACGWKIDSGCRMAYTGVLRSWFNNMRDAKIETKLKKLGIEIEYNKSTNTGLVRRTIDGSTTEFRAGGRFTLAGEFADAVGDATREMSVLERSWIRLSGRSLLGRKYGVNKFCFWGPLCKPLEQVTTGYRDAKMRFKMKIIEKVVAPLSNRMGLYLTCIVEGCGSGADFDRQFASMKQSLTRMTEAEAKAFAETVIRDTAGGKTLRQVVLNKVFTKLLGDMLGSKVAGAVGGVVTVVFAVVLFDMFNNIDQAVDEHKVSKMLADQNIEQYVNYYASHKTLLGEKNSGVLTADEAGAFISSYDGFETSRLYLNGFTDLTSNAVSALSGVVDTDTGDRVCRDGSKIPDGELVCPEQKIDRSVFFEEWRQSLLGHGIAAPFEIYRFDVIPGPAVVSIQSVVHPAVKVVNGVLNTAFSFVLDAVGAVVPGFNSFINWLSNSIGDLCKAFLSLWEPVILGEEIGQVAFESAVAGADAFVNIYMRDEMGAPKITTEQAQELYMKAMDDRAVRIANKSIWNRVFNFKDTDSLAFSVLGETSIALSSQQSLAGTFSSLFHNVAIAPIGHALNALSFDRAYAAANQDVVFGAFGMPQYGYALNCGEEGSESNPLCIDPEILTDEYCATLNQQWSDSIQYDPITGIEYYTVANPCKVDNVLNTVLGGMLSEPAEDSLVSTMGMDPNDVVASSTPDVPCFAGVDLGQQVGHANGVAYDIRVCEVTSPNGVDKIKVNSQISGIVDQMLKEAWAETDRMDLIGGALPGGGYRTFEQQQTIYDNRSCKGEIPDNCAAQPGYSRHEMGLAIDFENISKLATRAEPKYAWLEDHASKYGFSVLSYEHWHWSIGGAYAANE